MSMMSEHNLDQAKAQVSPVTPFAMIGDAEAEMCGPDGCAIPTGHAAFTDETAPVVSGPKPAK